MKKPVFTPNPEPEKPYMPQGYLTGHHELLPWSYVEERMMASRNYWIITASREAVPAATPVWGVWLDRTLYFDGSPLTRRGRNINENPRAIVHLESGDEVVILEGEAKIYQGKPERTLTERIAAAYTQKYADSGYSPTAEQWDEGGLFVFTPRKAMGWTRFPDNPTRWNLE